MLLQGLLRGGLRCCASGASSRRFLSFQPNDAALLSFIERISPSSRAKFDASSSSADADSLLSHSPGSTPFARIDQTRSERTGFPEVIFGSGKTAPQVLSILQSMALRRNAARSSSSSSSSSSGASQSQSQYAILATRVDPDVASACSAAFASTPALGVVEYCPVGRVLTVLPPRPPSSSSSSDVVPPSPPPSVPPRIVVVATAGTTDLPIAEEAALVLSFSGVPVVRLTDVGVAGLHRVVSSLPLLTSSSVSSVVVCAGMDGALPSVIAGLVEAPVIAVPTSVGYGASFGGVAALMTMLNSCAPGVSVVNIDGGFSAAAMAFKIWRGETKAREIAAGGKVQEAVRANKLPMPLCIVVTVEIDSERIAEFEKVIEEDAVGSRERENRGCVRFDVLRDSVQPNKFVFYEAYVNEEAFVAHKSMPHFKPWKLFKDSGGVLSQTVMRADGLFFGSRLP